MLKKQRTFCGKAALLASITTLSMSVNAAMNEGPVEVTQETQASAPAGLLENVLTDRLVLANDQDRYIVTFKKTGPAASKGQQ